MNLDEVLAQLKESYIKKLPLKLEMMKQQIEMKEFEKLREEFHKIKGTGKTYGVPEISLLGEVFEEILILSNFKPQMNWAIDSYSLLEDIHKTRTSRKEFNISADSRFKNLQLTLESFKK